MKMRRGENMAVVPLLLRLSLCKLASSAHGNSKHELMRVLDYSRKKFSTCKSEVEAMLQMLTITDMLLINKMYVNYTSDIDPGFFANSTERFGVHVEKVPFNKPGTVVNFINRWFETKTYKRITDVVTGIDVSLNSSILLVSAAHVKSTWEVAFNIILSEKLKFRKMDNKIVEIDMMKKSDNVLFFKDSEHEFKMVTLNLIWYGMSVTFILPDSRSTLMTLIDKFSLQPDILQNAKSKMTITRVALTLPRFKIKTSLDLDEVLKQLGVNQIFNGPSSGLDGILKSHKYSKNIYLSKVKHNVFVDFDEFGTFRNPSRAKEDARNNQEDPFNPSNPTFGQEFTADHPFIFMLNMQLTPTGGHNELALGVFYGP